MYESANADSKSVSIPPEYNYEGCIAIHNHPTNAIFSDWDIKTATKRNLAEVHVVCSNGHVYGFSTVVNGRKIGYHEYDLNVCSACMSISKDEQD